jgi:Domain of unknown function (DUF4350)
MPLNLSPEDRRLVVVASVVFLASALLAIFLSPAENDAEYATSYSAASEGAKAAYLLLKESGYRIERWSRPPDELKDAKNTLLIVTDPVDFPAQNEKSALDKFMADGGEIVLAGSLAPLFVSEIAPAEFPVSSGWQKFTAQMPSSQALNAPEIHIAAVSSWTKPASGIGLYGDDKQYVVMQYPHGKGSLLWLASSSVVSNAGMREAGNMEFLLSTAGSKSRQLLWDEYFHGHRSSAGVVSAHPQLTWMFGQLGFIAVAVLVTYSRRSGPRRSPRAESRLSPLEYVRALGELYEHARAANVAVEVAYERFRYTLIKRLGLRPSATNDELAQAVAQRSAVDREDLRSLLDACESARFHEDLSQKEALALAQRLHNYSVSLKLFPEVVEEDPTRRHGREKTK